MKVARKAKVIAVANHKGGVGKTTTVACIGSILASTGKRVLLIDLDGQANLTYSYIEDYQSKTIADVLLEGKDADVPIVSIEKNLDIIPSDIELAYAEMQLIGKISRERILANVLTFQRNKEEYYSALVEEYDYIIIDCPPSLGILTLNALTAADEVIIPVVAEILPIKGLERIKEAIEEVKESINPDLQMRGILLTRWEPTKHAKEIEQALREAMKEVVFTQKIRKNIRIAEAPAENKNVIKTSPNSHGAIDYQLFVEELIPGVFSKKEIKVLKQKK